MQFSIQIYLYCFVGCYLGGLLPRAAPFWEGTTDSHHACLFMLMAGTPGDWLRKLLWHATFFTLLALVLGQVVKLERGGHNKDLQECA